MPINSPLLGNNLPFTLIPHFKPDTETSYITSEYHRIIHYWFNPDKVETLLNVIEDIEDWFVKEFEDKNLDIKPCCSGTYTITMQYLEVQGARCYRQEMSTLDAVTVLHDKQPIIMIANAHACCIYICTNTGCIATCCTSTGCTII